MAILAISGSLQARSSNSELIARLRDLAPEGSVEIFDGYGEIPHFNPDIDGDVPHPMVERFRALVRAADVVVIATPEYAHGVPGSLKNALDWLVGSGELYDKPAIVLSAVPIVARAERAREQLAQTLRAQGAEVLAVVAVVNKGSAHDPVEVDVALSRVIELAGRPPR